MILIFTRNYFLSVPFEVKNCKTIREFKIEKYEKSSTWLSKILSDCIYWME